VAEPAAAHLDQHLAFAWRIEIDLDDMDRPGLGERTRRAAHGENSGFHFHKAILLQTRARASS